MAEEIEKPAAKEGEEKKAEEKKDSSSYELIDLDSDGIRIKTHTELDPAYVGHVEHITTEKCVISLVTASMMTADSEKLVHSGFIGSAGEYAALLVVNEPNGMVFSVIAQYFACARAGDEVKFTAIVRHSDNRKRDVEVVGHIGEIKIYEAKIVIVIPEYHPLKIKLLDVAGAND